MAPPPQNQKRQTYSRITNHEETAPATLRYHDDHTDNNIDEHANGGGGVVILRREGDVIVHEKPLCHQRHPPHHPEEEEDHPRNNTSMAPLSLEDSHQPTPPQQQHIQSAAYLYAFCAALNSCNLGYDLGVSTNAGPKLQQDPAMHHITDDQLELFLGSLNFWSIFGALLSPMVTDRWGRRATFATAAVAFVVGCLGMATASSFERLMVGRCIVGLGVGVGEAIDPMYIAEIAPTEIRGYLVSWAEAGVAVGVVLGFSSSLLMYALEGMGILEAFEDGVTDSDASSSYHQEWRIMLVLGTILPTIMLILLAAKVIPESPRWLLAKDRETEARRVLETIYPPSDDNNINNNKSVDKIVKEIQDSLALEQEAAQAVGWRGILCRPSPAVRRMLIVGVGISIIQQACGIDSIMFYLMFVIQESGIQSELGQIMALMLLGTVKLAFVLVGAKLFDRVGRRPLLLMSLVGCAASLAFVSLMFASDSQLSKILIVVALAFYLAFFSSGLGPGNWVVVSEVFATSIRAKAMMVAILPNRITATIMASTFLSLADALTWPGFFLILAGVCLGGAVFLFVYLPETKSRSLEEMSLYFAEITGDRTILDAEERLGKQHLSHATNQSQHSTDNGNDPPQSTHGQRQSVNTTTQPRIPGLAPIVLLTLCGSVDLSCALALPTYSRSGSRIHPTYNCGYRQISSGRIASTVTPIIFASSQSQPVQEDSSNERNNVNDDNDCTFLMDKVDQLLQERKPTDAFDYLMQAYAINSSFRGLRWRFARCLQLKVQFLEEELETARSAKDEISNVTPGQSVIEIEANLAQERMGLAALLIEQEEYEGAALHLREIVSSANMSLATAESAHRQVYDKACSMLYRTNAALCQWSSIEQDSATLTASILRHQEQGQTSTSGLVPPLHPFEALKWPGISLEQATYVALKYANRAQEIALAENPALSITTSTASSTEHPSSITIDVNAIQASTKSGMFKRIRIGYLSPDFTANHPLAFLMADVFRFHNRDQWEVFLYSMSAADEADRTSPQVQEIRQGADHWIQLDQQHPVQYAERIRQDNLDVLVDLCGHSGTSIIMELMARRLAPVQASYMGFPGSTGASNYIDYLVCDATVVPYQEPRIRQFYPEHLLLLPDCYFVNSHAYAVQREFHSESQLRVKKGIAEIPINRSRYNLPGEAFVLCCHSRADKIDLVTFRSWCRVLSRLSTDASDARPAVLWLLRSGEEMEQNLRKLARDEFGLGGDSIVFADVAPRDEHLRRLALADLFLDTPAYNAHTVGCDALFAGVPMVTLLRPLTGLEQASTDARPSWEVVPTDKWASRVGASLLKAAGIPDLIAPDMHTYEKLLFRLVTDVEWSESIRRELQDGITDCPLFDTATWVRNLEAGLAEAVSRSKRGKPPVDIALVTSGSQ